MSPREDLCWSTGPRIGSEGNPYCLQPAGHPGRHRSHPESGFTVEWGWPLCRANPETIRNAWLPESLREPKQPRELIAVGRQLLAAVDPALLPLSVDETPNGESFVCDCNGLEFAVPREADQATAELIAWWINNGPALADRVEAALALAERWEAATELGTSNPSIVTAAFARELRAVLEVPDDRA